VSNPWGCKYLRQQEIHLLSGDKLSSGRTLPAFKVDAVAMKVH